MKPEWLCTKLEPELFMTIENREAAARVCAQCPARATCLMDGIKDKAKEQVRGGFWFTPRGKFRQIKQPALTRSVPHALIDETHMEAWVKELVWMREVQTGISDPRPDRHRYWKRGRGCQATSRKHGDPCMDPICKEIARGQERQNTRKYRERKKAAA